MKMSLLFRQSGRVAPQTILLVGGSDDGHEPSCRRPYPPYQARVMRAQGVAVAAFDLVKASRDFNVDDIAILECGGDMWWVRAICAGESYASKHRPIEACKI